MLLQHMRDGVLPSVQQTKHVPSSSQSTKDFYLTFFLCNSHQSYAIVTHERRCLASKTVDRTILHPVLTAAKLTPFSFFSSSHPMLCPRDLVIPAAQQTEPAGITVTSSPQPEAKWEFGAALLHVRFGLYHWRPASGKGPTEGGVLLLFFVDLSGLLWD